MSLPQGLTCAAIADKYIQSSTQITRRIISDPVRFRSQGMLEEPKGVEGFALGHGSAVVRECL